MPQPIGLIDGNNFYASCERLFRPSLETEPVLVMSNNDGCVIARSQEVKALGVKMGVPVFQIRDLIERHGIHTFSANFSLYGDMSRRVNSLLGRYVRDLEVYSIDESFLNLAGYENRDVESYAREIRSAVKQGTGIPTCIGVGPSKTLAKLANAAAKKIRSFNGVCVLMDEAARRDLMNEFPVEDVWGVGARTAEKLMRIGIATASGLQHLDRRTARQIGGAVLERLVLELRGIPCGDINVIEPQRKSLAVTRSFGSALRGRDEVSTAVAAFASRAAEKLRQRGLVAGHLQVFMHTGFWKDAPQYSGSASMTLAPMTADSRSLLAGARACAWRSWRPGYEYVKAGVILTDLHRAANAPSDLFAERKPRSEILMAAMDEINARFGRGTLRPASLDVPSQWKMKQAHLSPRYTTRMDELALVRA